MGCGPSKPKPQYTVGQRVEAVKSKQIRKWKNPDHDMKEEETVLASNYTKGVVTAAHYIQPVPGAEADDETRCSGGGPAGGYDFDVKRVRRVRPTPLTPTQRSSRDS